MSTCREEDLPVNPFLALRVAFGMLLGEDDFRSMLGNPRGKQMLHTAWLHGSGVVWGYRVWRDGTWTLKVGPGLAVDGLGRELLQETTWTLDVRDWLKHHDASGHKSSTVDAYLVAEFRSCPTAPVPTLADPCDVTRKHDDYSRVVETVRLVLRPGPCPCPDPPIYHRVRVLLGLDEVGDDDPAGELAVASARAVADAPEDRRAAVLLEQFRILAAHDVMDRRPAEEPGEAFPTLFPVPPADAAVVLAGVRIRIRNTGECVEIEHVEPDPCVRRALLPTSTIQELACGWAPGVFGAGTDADAGGPRVIPDSLDWSEENTVLTVETTAPVNRRSLRNAVSVTSLSHEGWVEEDINRITVTDDEPYLIRIHLDDRPVYERVRLIVRGTGPRPAFGIDPPVPLAGVVGGPPGTVHDGHDAVLTVPNPAYLRRAEA